jgi:geranylgeranyl diphosphate synthase type I
VAAEPPASLVAIGERVSARIDALLAAEEERWAAVDPDLRAPVAALRAFVATGKRLRPAFCHWAWVGAGGDPDDPRVVDAGAALELVHAMALVHDDIIDGSVRRHGLPCLHVDFAERHRRRGWQGDGRRFGEGAALLIGDLAFVYADTLIAGAPPPAVDVFAELRLEVNVGQYLDLVGGAARQGSAEQARTISVYKSAKYTVERPLHLGAALAGHLDELAGPLTAFGIPLGEAFQLRDDLLGAFGGDGRLGKATGEDVRGGKATALYAIARSRASGDADTLLRERYGSADLSDEEVEAVQHVLEDTGARAEVEQRISALVDEALAALAGAPMATDAKRELGALARFVAAREF